MLLLVYFDFFLKKNLNFSQNDFFLLLLVSSFFLFHFIELLLVVTLLVFASVTEFRLLLSKEVSIKISKIFKTICFFSKIEIFQKSI